MYSAKSSRLRQFPYKIEICEGIENLLTLCSHHRSATLGRRRALVRSRHEPRVRDHGDADSHEGWLELTVRVAPSVRCVTPLTARRFPDLRSPGRPRDRSGKDVEPSRRQRPSARSWSSPALRADGPRVFSLIMDSVQI